MFVLDIFGEDFFTPLEQRSDSQLCDGAVLLGAAATSLWIDKAELQQRLEAGFGELLPQFATRIRV